MPAKTQICDSGKVKNAISRIADAIISEFNSSKSKKFAFIGLHKQGVPLARRLIAEIEQKTGFCPELALLDISMYRDDVGIRSALPIIRETEIPFDISGQAVILVDDVLSTGRTIRAALDAITDYGRPPLIRLAVMVDRGNREFPILADYAGMKIIPGEGRKIVVEFEESDGHDGIFEVDWETSTKGD
ncbi:MAG: bifunctional pyr operon transcriptional regulator/uracil phosphoribosyltransferase PyrR [Victivallaceae bacterium]